MTLQFIQIDQAWAFLYCNEIVNVAGIKFFDQRSHAVRAARQTGMEVTKSGRVVSPTKARRFN
jgi:hypothetical protein